MKNDASCEKSIFLRYNTSSALIQTPLIGFMSYFHIVKFKEENHCCSIDVLRYFDIELRLSQHIIQTYFITNNNAVNTRPVTIYARM